MENFRLAAGCAGIASAISFTAGHPIKGLIFGVTAALLAGWSGVLQKRQRNISN